MMGSRKAVNARNDIGIAWDDIEIRMTLGSVGMTCASRKSWNDFEIPNIEDDVGGDGTPGGADAAHFAVSAATGGDPSL